MPRRLLDKLAALLKPSAARAGRYRCLAAGCGWEGLIQRRPARSVVPTAATEALSTGGTPRQVVRGLAGAGALAGVALAVAASVSLLWPPVETVRVGPHRVERGVSLDGDKLPADHPLLLATSPTTETDEVEPGSESASAPVPATSTAQSAMRTAAASAAALPPAPTRAAQRQGLTLRRHCAWGDPGRNPYKGSVELALRTARLPESVIQRIAADVKARKVTDRLSISNGSVRADTSGRRFDPNRVAMTYGHTLCVDTKVNFRRDHVERADLYEASDGKGNVVAVMVPDVCGNVSVLSEVAEDEDLKAADAARKEGRQVALRRLPQALVYNDDEAGGGGGNGGRTRTSAPGSASNAVATPGTLPISVIGLAALAWCHSRRRRRR